ncbi:class I SAM-dependent methyltransferase [Nostoc sp. 'Peltigera malacea cyanobiont' DB3992]|uniref:class I SAM-dependent methyltransferase n=1 Tax=Nostoc sp. 'Peltigera malacea cyanobiont' DB3992 TaxID=1206980 RepID=UPI000C051682|nr:class I SAM-dependent methyltransferase [Nostoc sp. 'Peltigera malacea cyanobiont' DB3992]PHM06481.1 SAM-dependent methyltransferase [Nostoc sp. 'Peltigera malacea cyanobiont' DB3992]
MTNTILNIQTATGHEVLAAAGKKYLRPGGRIVTEKLFQWANFQPGETVLELGSSFGYSAIALAKSYHIKVVGIEKNPDSVASARTNICAAGLENQVEIIEGNIFNLEAISGKFDYVLAEAILTMQSPLGKAKILAEIHNRLKPGGKFLSHELLASDKEEQIRADLARVIRVNSTPLSESNWITAFATAGLQVEKCQTDSMNLLNLGRIFQDEGFFNTTRIFWNILTQRDIRNRVLEIHQVFHKYQQELGYIILCAVAQ